jgi:hypothetical protein
MTSAEACGRAASARRTITRGAVTRSPAARSSSVGDVDGTTPTIPAPILDAVKELTPTVLTPGVPAAGTTAMTEGTWR